MTCICRAFDGHLFLLCPIFNPHDDFVSIIKHPLFNILQNSGMETSQFITWIGCGTVYPKCILLVYRCKKLLTIKVTLHLPGRSSCPPLRGGHLCCMLLNFRLKGNPETRHWFTSEASFNAYLNPRAKINHF